ncbi:protein TIFY 9-like isoform X2 [Lycium barbarum]|uniref:protein TIFY 9-like isoform X2 n=1 Tax=Lycium barbarum TaxID=112863 RepID=UPI00293EF4EB|nr:protein TIFY 9-like isoform X2 [Lycium barbarum]
MARSAVELDFFSMEKESNYAKHENGISFGDIRSVILKTNTEVMKTAISREDYSQLALFSPASRLHCGLENGTKTAPLTIFYDGAAAVYDVTSDEAEGILRFAERSKIMDAFSPRKQLFVETFSGDLPFARRNSLHRFLEKRKERLTVVSPYGFPQPPIYGSLAHTASKSKN